MGAERDVGEAVHLIPPPTSTHRSNPSRGETSKLSKNEEVNIFEGASDSLKLLAGFSAQMVENLEAWLLEVLWVFLGILFLFSEIASYMTAF